MEADLHWAETQRLAALRRYEILDTPREKEFDDIVSVVAAVCETPISVINFIDEGRQWFKAEVGLGVRETPLPASICAHAILQHELFIVPDTLKDPRFSNNPLVTGAPHLRFYAGAILKTAEGLPLGTICVLDYKPRGLDEKQKALLGLMASQIMRILELRRLMAAERFAREKAEQLAKENETLAQESDHRVMNSLQLVSSVLALQRRGASAKARAELDDAQRRVMAIATVHRQLHSAGKLAEIDIDAFLIRLCESLQENAPAQISSLKVNAGHARLSSDKASALGLIVSELIANSFRHAFPDGRAGSVEVAFSSGEKGWTLSVVDDGVGLPASFDPAASRGVGMRVILSLVSRLNATLTPSSHSSKTAFVVRHKEGLGA